ncbi:mucin-binding protein [Lactobacillus gasseri]|uniref:mucin-binding protein n=1 Tax=Lactobacillus gasseri TaxID=1596 RepID=UPI00336A96D8
MPRLLNYMAQDSSIVVKDPSRDTKVTYYTFAEIKELSSAKNLKTEIQSIDGKTATSNVVSLPVNGKRRKAVVTFVDLSNNATQIASSGVLSGNVGDKITDLYNTSKQVEELKKKGYEVVYNGFDPKGASKYFEEDQRKVATFTVAVKKVKQLKPKEEKQAEKTSKKVKEKSKAANSDEKKKKNHKVLKYIFPWMK